MGLLESFNETVLYLKVLLQDLKLYKEKLSLLLELFCQKSIGFLRTFTHLQMKNI